MKKDHCLKVKKREAQCNTLERPWQCIFLASGSSGYKPAPLSVYCGKEWNSLGLQIALCKLHICKLVLFKVLSLAALFYLVKGF